MLSIPASLSPAIIYGNIFIHGHSAGQACRFVNIFLSLFFFWSMTDFVIYAASILYQFLINLSNAFNCLLHGVRAKAEYNTGNFWPRFAYSFYCDAPAKRTKCLCRQFHLFGVNSILEGFDLASMERVQAFYKPGTE